MSRERIEEFILHPAFLSIPIWVAVIIILPPIFSKYAVRHLKDVFSVDVISYFYSDLDCDGNSEKISVDLADDERTKIIVYKNDRIVDQFNIEYQPTHLSSILFDDYNHDNYLEIYVFTASDDSIFLSIIDPLKSGKTILSGRYVDSWQKAEDSDSNPSIRPLGTMEGGESQSDLFFVIQSGYCLKPRKLYRYIIDRDTLFKSPEAGFNISNCIIKDLDNDNMPEFIPEIQAPGNYQVEYPYTDMFSWFIIFDHEMKFMFDPVKILPYPSDAYTVPVKYDGKLHLAAYFKYTGSEEIPSSLCLFDIKGNKLKEMIVDNIDKSNSRIFTADYNGNQTFFFLKNLDGEVEEYDSQLSIVKKITISPLGEFSPRESMDVDGDGRKEYIFASGDTKSIVFVRDNFRDPAFYHLEEGLKAIETFHTSLYLENGSKPAIYIQFPGHGLMLRYQKNPLYYLKYPLYASIYGSILAFILILSRIQSYRLRQKQETEKRIASLQMKAIKNQIDPHFTLNILNLIGSLYSNPKNRKKADYLFGKYARLIRQTVISSDQIIVPLSEELDFLRNYPDLEKFRNEDNFSYSIEI
ncbi:MAG: histidine kinase, partial [Bacteroidales bacterium]|nr:histidine kinase [Bacteroidales bacterium]